GFSAAHVEAQPYGELACCLQDEGGDLLVDAFGGEAEGGGDDGEGADDVAGVVADGGGDGADVFEVLADVDGVAGRGDGAELLQECLAIDDGPLRQARQAVGEERAHVILRLEGEIRLAGGGAVQR